MTPRAKLTCSAEMPWPSMMARWCLKANCSIGPNSEVVVAITHSNDTACVLNGRDGGGGGRIGGTGGQSGGGG